MLIDVALLPDQARAWHDVICIVVDALRASSTIVVALERGARLVIPVASIAQGRRLARGDGELFCGENDESGTSSFDLNNSPSELNKLNLRGKTIVLYTVNGARVIRQNASARHLLIGSLLNARACCKQALEFQRASGADIGIVCAGNGRRFALDDMYVAGHLVHELQRLAGECQPAPIVSEQAAAAAKLANCAPDAAAFLGDTWSGQWLAQYGPRVDVAFCAQINASQVVPVGRTEGVFGLAAYSC